MRQANEISRTRRRRRCLWCGELFEPDSRSKGKQRYCSKQECQIKRQRKNEKDWCRNNSGSVAYYKSKWLKRHPDYNKKRRIQNPVIAEKNREDTRVRMKKTRWQAMFDKNKSILTQLVDKNKDSFCLMSGRWLFLRLTRTSRWTKEAILRHTGGNIKRIANCLPKGKLYNLSGVF